MSEPSQITQTVKESQYAATSATGDASVYIYNYYGYREEVRVEPVKADETVTDAQLPSPYRGLFHFGPEDGEFFFGREIFVKELVQATQTHNFIPVLGASGSGKSSVILAGLVPKLQQSGHWRFTHFRPGAMRTISTVDPFYALATALVPLYEPNLNSTAQLAQASDLAEYLRNGKVLLGDVITKIQYNYPQDRTLLIADQFEELYTLCQDEALRRDFLNMLLKSISSPCSPVAPAKSPLVLVITMRVDFLGNALSYPAFADLMRQRQIQIRSMNREELSQVIEKPAQKLGVKFETGLAKRILDEVEDEPGNLPLLEFALTLLWSKRQGNQLTHEAYEEIGEVKGALTKYAEQKYSELNPNQQEQVQRVFVQLVRPGEGAEDTRRLATKDELGEARWSLVKQLADERLVVTSRNTAEQETVEVVHEALIRNWSQLRQWMEKDRWFRAWQERLRAAMHQWEETKRDEGALLRGVSLSEAEEKLKERREELSPSEQEFIQQSVELRECLRREEKTRRHRGIATISAAAVAIITILGGTTWYQSKQAMLNSEKTHYYSLGLNKVVNNDYHAALESFNQVVKLDPNDPQAYYGLGNVRSKLRDQKGALGDYSHAIQLDFNFAHAYTSRGVVRSDLRDKKGALDDYNHAIRLDPNDAYAYIDRGTVRSDLGDKKGALEDYNHAIRLDPNDAYAYIDRGTVRSDMRDKKGALDDYNHAIQLDPNDAYAYIDRGTVRSDMRDKKGALDDYNHAIQLDPNYRRNLSLPVQFQLIQPSPHGSEPWFQSQSIPLSQRSTPRSFQVSPISHSQSIPLSQRSTPPQSIPLSQRSTPLSPKGQQILCQQFPLNSRCSGSKH